MSYNNDAAENGIEKIQKYASLYGLNETTGVEIEEMSLMDEGPTMAEIMGLELPGAKGKVLREIFR